MSLTKEVFDGIVNLAEPKVVKVGDLTYSDRAMKRIEPEPFTHALLKLSTLSGLVSSLPFIGSGAPDEKVIIRIVSHLWVIVESQGYDDQLKRPAFSQCAIAETTHRFGQWLDHETFIIWLQSMFTPAGDRDTLVKLAGSLTASAVLTSDDDSISQVVSTRVGVSLKGQEQVKPRVTLAPYRTFREAVQPPSEFLIRLKQEGDGIPKVGLFEADGGTWQNDAAENVAKKIEELLGDKLAQYPVIR